MKTLRAILIIIIILVLIPVVSWLLWNFKPNRPLDLLVLDKTVLGFEKKEHRALFWMLINEKFVKEDKKAYNMHKDYFGFHPLKPEKSRKYEVKRIKLTDIEKLAMQYDGVYYADTYGVFFNEWYRRPSATGKGTLIEGGLNNNDYLFLKRLYDENKLIISEYNFFGPPTVPLVRRKAEELLGLTWSGWTGKYCHQLNPKKNKDLPDWIVGMYNQKNNEGWNFTGPGIILINEATKSVVVLESEEHLEVDVPEIQTTEIGKEEYDLPESVHYPNWFDITMNNGNTVVAEFKIHINMEGKNMLDKYNLPSRFPAVIESNGSAPYFYFGGDFSEYPVKMFTAKLKGIRTFENMFYNHKPQSPSKFYWTYYIPMVSQILNEYQEGLQSE